MTKINRSSVNLLAEYSRRRNMALSVFRPQKHQEPIYKNYSRELLIRGGVRCSVAGTEVWKCRKGSNFEICKIEDLQVGDSIAATSTGNKRQDICVATVSSVAHFEEEAFRLTTEQGYTLSGTHDHPVLARPPKHNNFGQWVHLKDLQPDWHVRMANPTTSELWWESIKSTETIGKQPIVAISTSTETYISNGIVSHNSGKSLNASVMFSAIATDTPVTFEDGTQMDMRQPWQKNRCLKMWVIGYDSKHIGQTIFRLLFKKGSFKTISDEKTGLLRAYREWEPADRKRSDKVKDSNPLIPAAFIDPNGWDWENKKGKEFKSVIIWHPQTHEPLAEIYAFSSKAEPKQGDPVDVIWIDEAIQDPKHYEEWQSRIVDNRGRIFWSSWPKTDNEALMLLTEEAEKEKDKPEPRVREVVISTSENKTLSEKNKEEFLGGLSDEARMARDKGMYLTDLQRAYPLYDREKHCVTIDDIDNIPEDDLISRELSKTDGIPPREWTKELILDPGTQHPAILFCAIPPPKFGNYRIVFQEVYPGRADADQLAEEAAKQSKGQRFYRFIIDDQAGKQQQMGYDAKVADNYIRAFKRARLKSIALGYKFVPGCHDVGGRMGTLRELLHYQDNQDYPTLRIVNHRCPQLCKQLKQYKQARVNNDTKEDRPAPGQRLDLAVCLEYWSASKPKYVPYTLTPEDGGEAYLSWFRKFGNRRQKDGGHSIGPSYATGN